jgi:uncharacterized protein YqjF (DUF2071 family)
MPTTHPHSQPTGTLADPVAAEPVSADPPAKPKPTVLRQRWSELAYFHWRYDPDEVQRLLPNGLRVDTFDGSAWVGLIPFEMRNVQIGPTPPVPWLGSFIEINVRTYVVDELGRRSVWFFSLDVPRSVIVGIARTVFALPYCWAAAEHTVDVDHHRYRMTRRRPHRSSPRADMAFQVGDRIPEENVGELEHFLSARWGLVTERFGSLLHGRVDHPRWPLHEVDRIEIDQDVIEAAGLSTPVGQPHAMYSPGVDVEVAWFEKIRRPEGT